MAAPTNQSANQTVPDMMRDVQRRFVVAVSWMRRIRLNSASRRCRSVSGVFAFSLLSPLGLGWGDEDEEGGLEEEIGSRMVFSGFFSRCLIRRRRSFSTIRADIFSLPRSRTSERIEPITRPRIMMPPIAKGKRRARPRCVTGL